MTNDKIPIIPASEVPSQDKWVFLDTIKNIEKLQLSYEQKVIFFDVVVEGYKLALELLYEFKKEYENYPDIDGAIRSYLSGIGDAFSKFEDLIGYIIKSDISYEKQVKLLDAMVISSKSTLDIFAEADDDWGNPWEWKSRYIDITTFYFMGIREAIDKFHEIFEYLHTYVVLYEDVREYFELYDDGIHHVLNNYPFEIEILAIIINDLDKIKKEEYISKEYLWKAILDYIDKMS